MAFIHKFDCISLRNLTSYFYVFILLYFQRGLIDFYTNGSKKPEEEKANGWGSVIIGGALGAFALGALIINKA